VGFYNRKSFLLTIIYGETIIIIALVYNAWWMAEAYDQMSTLNFFGFAVYAFNIFGGCLLAVFTGSHINFLMHNQTTIEALQQKNLDQVIFLVNGSKKFYSLIRGL
jgi:small neutral amino acid transporter SnatA (MarC family)